MTSSNPALPEPGLDLLHAEGAEPAASSPAPAAGDPVPVFTVRQQRMRRRMQRTPEWLGAFLAGNSREKTRFKREMATIRGSVVWLVRQRRQGQWTSQERAHLREMMRTASSVSPYLVIWVVPGSLLLLPFLAWFIDHRRKGRTFPPPTSEAPQATPVAQPVPHAAFLPSGESGRASALRCAGMAGTRSESVELSEP